MSVERWLVVAGADLAAEDQRNVTLVKDADLSFKESWPKETERVRHDAVSVWKVENDDWRLRLVAGRQMAGSTSVQVLLAEQTLAVGDSPSPLPLSPPDVSAGSITLPSGCTRMRAPISVSRCLRALELSR